MNLYFIRHAPTEANINGNMVKNYDAYNIMPFDAVRWHNTVGKFLPKDFKLFCSPIKRCKQTLEVLFPGIKYTTLETLREFDCSALNGKNFWEMSEEEFYKLVPLTKDIIEYQMENLLWDLVANGDPENVVIIGHGFFGRCLYSYWNNDDDTPFEILNSKNYQFKNLDMMEKGNNTIITHRYLRS